MNELDLIARLSRQLPLNATVQVGPGDDCAVLDLGLPDRWLLFKTDAVVEGVHFAPGTAPEKVGHKALGRCLSDVAAMSGLPSCALVTLALPRAFEAAYAEGIYAGLSALARRHDIAIVGGETTTNPERLLLSIAVLGTVEPARCIRRAGARPGDAIFVTGELGGALAGKHLEFEPRLTEARWLTEHFQVHSMIDLSDGLAGDLRHLLDAGNVGAELLARAIPISRAARAGARAPADGHATGESAGPNPPLVAALTDGEDFELLFTVASRDAVPLRDAWSARFPSPRLSCIGQIRAKPGLAIRDAQGLRPLTLRGYTHFA